MNRAGGRSLRSLEPMSRDEEWIFLRRGVRISHFLYTQCFGRRLGYKYWHVKGSGLEVWDSKTRRMINPVVSIFSGLYLCFQEGVFRLWRSKGEDGIWVVGGSSKKAACPRLSTRIAYVVDDERKNQ